MPWAPISRLVAWLTTDPVWAAYARMRPSWRGLEALEVAREELGRGEEGSNNMGRHLDRYREGRGGSGAWCAAFVSYCIREASRRRGERPVIRGSNGARRLYRQCVAVGMRVEPEDIQPGDVVLWARGRKAWQGHIGIVSRVERDEAGAVSGWYYIAGNEGRYPAVVTERRGHSRRLIGFARLY